MSADNTVDLALQLLLSATSFASSLTQAIAQHRANPSDEALKKQLTTLADNYEAERKRVTALVNGEAAAPTQGPAANQTKVL